MLSIKREARTVKMIFPDHVPMLASREGAVFHTLTTGMSTQTTHIPIIVLAGSDNEELKRKVFEHGIAPFMQKPYDLKKLVEEIGRIFHQDSITATCKQPFPGYRSPSLRFQNGDYVKPLKRARTDTGLPNQKLKNSITTD